MVRSRLLQATIRNVSNRSLSSSATPLASTINGLAVHDSVKMLIDNRTIEGNPQLTNNRGLTSFTTPSPTATTPQRFFSSSTEDLTAILERELAEELEGDNTSPPPELAELEEDIKENWTILSSSSSDAFSGGSGSASATIKMYKKDATKNGSKVSILFHCQDSLPTDDGGEGNGGGGGFLDTGFVETDQGDNEEEEEESAAVRFTLVVSKAGKVMIMKCLSEDAEAVVEGLTVVSEEQVVTGKEGEVDEMLYQGPEFSELDEALQEALTSYVQNECGVTSDVAAFIAMYADYKEQMEYVSWLKNVKAIVS